MKSIVKTREMVMDTYDLQCSGPFSLKEDRFKRTLEIMPFFKLLPEGNPHETPEMLGAELDLLQAMFLCKVFDQMFKISAVPVPTRYWEPKVSVEDAWQIALAEHQRVRDEHPDWLLGDLDEKWSPYSFATYSQVYHFWCTNGKAQKEGKIPGMWGVMVDRVDGSIWTREHVDALQVMDSLIRKL